MKILTQILITITTICSLLVGNTFKSTGDLTLYLDCYQYQGSENSTLVELSYSIDLSYLKYVDESEISKSMDLILNIESTKGNKVFNKSLNVEYENIINSRFVIFGLQSINTSNDSIRISLDFNDYNLNRHGRVQGLLAVNKFNADPSLSDLMIVKEVNKNRVDAEFSKGGLNFIPAPNRNIDLESMKKVFYSYYQINNLSFTDTSDSWYIPSYNIYKSDGDLVTSSQGDSVLMTSSNSSRIEILNLGSLVVGKYLLKVTIEDLNTEYLISKEQNFSISPKQIGINQMMPMEKDDIKKYQKQIKYIATYEEKKLFKKLSNEGKQNFILNFWSRRDPDKSTVKNEFLIEHFNRLQYCEDNIRGGIDSDMGRVYILYGKPVEIRRNFSNTTINKPVETWFYALNGVKEFVFVDRMENGEYVLVHSNHDDEIFNPNWVNNF